MNKFNWIYVDDAGKKNTIGIMHGAKTGHLLIYCNTKILRIDFKVFDSKTYSFFIEEELIEIVVERKGNQFAYGFDINKEVDTPRNRFRKQEEQRNLKMIGIFFLGFFIFIGTIVFVVSKNRQQNKAQDQAMILSKENSETTFAKIFIDTIAYKKNYSFVANNQIYQIPISNLAFQEASQQLVFPMEDQDEFTLIFLPQNPYNHKIQWTQPSDLQITRYQNRAIQKELDHHENIDLQKATCYVTLAYEMKGLDGLAYFYHQNTFPSKEKKHHSDSYKRLIRDIAFKKAVDEKCWE